MTKISGIVIAGNQIGRELGVPTANIALQADCEIADGVYAAKVCINNTEHYAVANIGHKPTISPNNEVRGAEIHIIDWNGDLYGKSIEVELVTRLRDEQRFNSLDELKQQIEIDITKAKDIK